LLKTNKNQKIFFFLLKLVLFAGVLYMIYSQLERVDDNAWEDFNLVNPWSLVLVAILVVPNMWVAYKKWKVTLGIMGEDNDNHRTSQSFFAGLVMGMVTPNMMGNFIGRFYYFPKEHRGTITILTMFSNTAQLISTLIFGVTAVLVVGEIYMVGGGTKMIVLLLSGTAISFFCYFFADHVLRLFKKRKWLYNSREILKDHPSYRWIMIFWSMVRFVIFTTQFSLVMHAFGEEINFVLVLAIWQIYLITLMIPSLFLGKLGVKEMVAISVLGPLGMNEFSILFTSLIIWFVNSMSPALVGLIVCKRPES
jgi:hypothetical protein